MMAGVDGDSRDDRCDVMGLLMVEWLVVMMMEMTGWGSQKLFISHNRWWLWVWEPALRV